MPRAPMYDQTFDDPEKGSLAEEEHLEDDGFNARLSEDSTVEELEDGSAVVHLDEDEEDEEGSAEFGENLADQLDPAWLASVGDRLIETVRRDKEDREKRDTQYAEGIKRTGIGEPAPGGADFAGASKAAHPALLEGCVDFAARAIKELFPAAGPCKSHIIGKVTKAKQEKADRKRQYMNWQLTTQIKEYRAELEQTLSQVPLGGSQFMKMWYSDRVERPRAEFVPLDDCFIPFAATDFYTAARQTHRQRITQQEYEDRVESGLYIDAHLGEASAGLMEDSAAAQATDKIEGKDESAYNEDGVREIYEIYCDELVEDDTFADGKRAPYIITVDVSSSRVLGFYRNWAENDQKLEKLDWMTEWGFIPWRGAYKLGLAHLIGGMSGAMTGALRALLDSALINTIPAGLRLKGARISGQSITVSPTELTEIEGPATVDDIRKIAMPFPFNPPSAVLFELLQWLSVQAKSVVGTAEEKIADINANAPVGTTLAMIEQGSITYTAIHGRLHESQKRMMAILHRIDATTLDDEVTVEELGDLVVRREDFQGPMDVVPVSDPNIFSDTQRYAQQQAVDQLAANPMYASFFKTPELLKRTLQLLKYPDYEGVLSVPGDPKELDALSENIEAHKQETTLKEYPQQDHLAHIKVHMAHILSPVFCNNPTMAMPAMPKLLEHIKEHLLALYAQHTLAATEAVRAMGYAKGTSDEDMQAEAVVFADQQLVQDLGPLLEMFMQAQELVKKYMPPPQVPPELQAKQLEVSSREKIADADRQFKQQQARQEQSAENARHQQEMAVAQENANNAMESEGAQRELTATLSAMKEEYAAEREANKAQLAAVQTANAAELEATRAANAQALEQMRADNAQTLVVLTQVLQAVQAAMVPQGGGGPDGKAPAKVEPGRVAFFMTKVAEAVSSIMARDQKKDDQDPPTPRG